MTALEVMLMRNGGSLVVAPSFCACEDSGSCQLQRRLLLERRRDHQKNQQHDQHVHQRDDDDGRRVAAFADDEAHKLKGDRASTQHPLSGWRFAAFDVGVEFRTCDLLHFSFDIAAG